MKSCGVGCFLATVFLFPQQSILAYTFGLFLGRLTVLRLWSYFYIFITRYDLLSMTEGSFGGSLGRCLTVGIEVYDCGCYLFYCCCFFLRFYYSIALRGSYILRFYIFFFYAFLACAFLYQFYSFGFSPSVGKEGASCKVPPNSSYGAYKYAPFACMGLSSPVLAMVLAWDHLPSPPRQSTRAASSLFYSTSVFCWTFLPLLELSLISLTLFFFGSGYVSGTNYTVCNC